MAAPAITARQIPVAIQQRDGYQILIANAAHPAVEFYEMAITPFDVDNGDPINTTTQFNVGSESFAPRALWKPGPVEVTAAYDYKVIATIYDLQGVETSWTINYPNLGTDSFYGYLRNFKRSAIKHGSMPEATITIVVTNWDYTNNIVVVPVWTPPAGTN